MWCSWSVGGLPQRDSGIKPQTAKQIGVSQLDREIQSKDCLLEKSCAEQKRPALVPPCSFISCGGGGGGPLREHGFSSKANCAVWSSYFLKEDKNGTPPWLSHSAVGGEKHTHTRIYMAASKTLCCSNEANLTLTSEPRWPNSPHVLSAFHCP